MQEKKLEFDKVVVRVQYNRVLTKDDLEESCVKFLKKAIQSNKEKDYGNNNTSRTIGKKQVLDR